MCLVGQETGGHPGMSDVSTLVMIPKVSRLVKIPVLAGGGLADGRGLLAALALGADGIVMGTRFMATRESMVHDHIKEWMVKAQESDTVVIQRSIGSPARVARNGPALEVERREQAGATLEDLLPLISGRRAGRAVYGEGDPEGGVWSLGQSVGLIDSIPTVAELIQSMIQEAESQRHEVNGWFSSTLKENASVGKSG